MGLVRRTKGTARRIAEAAGEVARQPLSDQSFEVPGKGQVTRAKRVAAGTNSARRAKKRRG